MKKIYLFILFLISSILANAQTFTFGGINYNVTDATNFYVEVGNNVGFAGATANIPASVPYNSQTYTVKSIANYAFDDCDSLTSIVLPNSVTSIGSYAFNSCSFLNSITLPTTITNIADGTFQFCSQLTSITIPNLVTTIGNNAFRYCTSNTNIIIPNSVTSIGSFAFGSNYSLIDVTIPSSVTSIGDYAFAYLYSLNSFTVNWQTPLPIGSNFFEGTNINGKTLNVPGGTANLYNTAPVWKEFNIIAGPDTTPRGCWAEISAGGQHTLAIAQDGTLWAWGNNTYKQLGNNATGNVTSPVQISNERNWEFVSAGEFHSLAIKKNGTLWAWGRNNYGQLGNGNTTQVNVPTQIGSETNWSNVYAGYHHSVAKKTDNTLYAWGENTYGQIGNNTTSALQLTPTLVNGTNWQTVSLGRGHTMALKVNGELWAWGRNTFGQLGLGNTNNVSVPTRVDSNLWKSIEAGDYHNVGIRDNSTLYSWGDNFIGQLGLGDTNQRNSPTQIGAETTWTAIAAGLYNGYAVKKVGALSTLWAWGDNYKGQLGNGTFTEQFSPVLVGADTDYYSVIAGNENAIAQKTAGTYTSWGDNQSGQLGNGSTLPNTTGQNTPAVMGCAGNILAFDGVDDRVVIQNLGTGILGDNSANESYSFIMKVKISSVGATTLISKKTSMPSSQGFSIETNASGVVFFDQAYGGVFRRVQASSPLAANTWYTISATFDYPNKTHKLYIDGNEIATYTDTATPQFVTTSVKITIGMPEGNSPSSFSTSFAVNMSQAFNIPLDRINIVSVSSRNNQAQQNVEPINYLFKYLFNQGIADANNAGLTTVANELGSSVNGTLENFALIGSTSNWSNDTTAGETLNTKDYSIADNVKVYPNPSNGYFTIETKEELTIKVFDLVGKLIYTSNLNTGTNTIDISNYKAGVYFLNATNNSDKTNTVKLIKN